jgi:hypothetical protein
MSKLDRKSKSRRIRIEHEAELGPEDTAVYLEGLVRGLRDGRIALYEGAPAFEIDSDSDIELEGRARQRRRGMRIDLRLSLRALVLGDELENDEEEGTNGDKEPEKEAEEEELLPAAPLDSQAVAQQAESSMPEAIQREPSADGAARELPTAVEAPSDQGVQGAQAPPDTNDAVASPRPEAATGETIPSFATPSAGAAQPEAEQSSSPRPAGSMPDEMSF